VKLSVGVAVVIILALIGTVVAAYCYTQLQQNVTLFNENSMQLDGQSYRDWLANGLTLDGYLYVGSTRVVGSVSSVGTGVDFYLVNSTGWPSVMADMGLRSTLSWVHLNSSVLSSQSGGRFSFNPRWSDYYVIVLVNDEYPDVNNASVNVNITFQYTDLFSFGGFIFGLVILGFAIVLLTLMKLRKARARAKLNNVSANSTASLGMKALSWLGSSNSSWNRSLTVFLSFSMAHNLVNHVLKFFHVVFQFLLIETQC